MAETKKYDETAALWKGKGEKQYWTGRVNSDMKAGDRIIMFPFKKANEADPDFVIRQDKPLEKKENVREMAYG